ncbi:hypothetical protein [Sphingomonas bacterium]|uniref:hypothetical protein n=1 Tax=Sphingomonas bacterium TaxID=1895847 RepID=UPI002613B6EF|nr:hypothetical protein [Sphingomonas bacterium]MDB5678466.1 hypothetical protein [Sphingomonas bacterium]
MRIAPIALALAGLAGAAAPAAERDPLAGRAAGKPVDCVDQARLGGPEIIDSRTLLYRDGRTIWRNDLPAACPGLRPMATLIVELYGSQLCRNDHVRAQEVGSVIPGPVCRLGSFTPYDLAAK